MIRNGNICFVPTSLAAPEICDREFISGLSVSSAPLTIREGAPMSKHTFNARRIVRVLTRLKV